MRFLYSLGFDIEATSFFQLTFDCQMTLHEFVEFCVADAKRQDEIGKKCISIMKFIA